MYVRELRIYACVYECLNSLFNSLPNVVMPAREESDDVHQHSF